jgi:hypothetical protein
MLKHNAATFLTYRTLQVSSHNDPRLLPNPVNRVVDALLATQKFKPEHVHRVKSELLCHVSEAIVRLFLGAHLKLVAQQTPGTTAKFACDPDNDVTLAVAIALGRVDLTT